MYHYRIKAHHHNKSKKPHKIAVILPKDRKDDKYQCHDQDQREIRKEPEVQVKKISNIAGHIEYGEGSEIAAVLAHVDVVPAGDGWSTEPFALTEKDSKLK